MSDDETIPAPARARPARRLTIRDVAQSAGVSIGTVSAVLNDSAVVAADTRRHVQRIITELGFEPNNSARSLKRGRISSIGFIVPDLGNPFFAAVAEGIQTALVGRDVLLVLCMTGARPEQEEYYAKVLRTQRLDGVVYLSGTGMPSASLMELARKGAVVFVDERLPGVDVPFVAATNRLGARGVAAHVIAAGHRRIAIVSGPPRLWTSEQRLAGFREALAGGGLDPDGAVVFEGDYEEASGYAAASRLLGAAPAGERPTAILCANDLMAMGVIRYCREAGLSIPRDLSVTGFDDIPSSAFLDPALTTVAQPGREMGAAAARWLLNLSGIDTAMPARTEFETQIVLRDSVGPVAGA
ncbi:LacI family DNA-binding transcriptional regulator [Methylobrevis pamukkalensis]|uniref:HTH-type transcriptional repressor CytR n=1 Tax=Methylobrevis pamukkalensis TaxID=1439726 RepID=A0A1E3H671_9HYPH|nr:LacI family DNA-binding transcriptional regulator [Methylobrevis pamukkalensis]ODN71814.1 HTH-type transcriptional repressor CytR [Methylobrevis pamukkalensis]